MLKSPGGEWGNADGCAWGANESWRLNTPASSPKPRRKDGPKGATHDGRRVREHPLQPMETTEANEGRGDDGCRAREQSMQLVETSDRRRSNEGRGADQSSRRRGEDSYEDRSPKTGVSHGAGAVDNR